ncbi:Fur family transcriptional regulator [Calorimonas adulescens]|uniref:Transcriptional repressor n=1 Tax=Calorimonas adulescens TaxID=2606906 RepID=A0A5D8Q8P6_9THEO|nr:Fur family transcriptional regulator [Calorimonas adulescens]TZE80950.1 transcriptional repressor [Calorimonas adulescens]
MDERIPLIKDLLRKSGYRLTKQKEVILKAILNENRHLTVEEIYEKIKRHGIGLATVYRAINMFQDTGIVKRIDINNKRYYELKIYSKKPLHIHFKCMKCGKVIDVDNMEIIIEYLKINNKAEKFYGFEIDDADIILNGICKECKDCNTS